MTKNKFWKAYNNREFEKLLPIFHQAVSFDFDIEKETTHASWLEDYEQLHFLWRLKAESYTPFIKDIFERFENGTSYRVMIQEKELEKQRKLASVKADLTDFKSVDQIPLGEITFKKDENSLFCLTIPILTYLFEGNVFEDKFLEFTPIEINKNHLQIGKIDFAVNQFDQSIYLFDAHNPVDLQSIEFKKNAAGFIKLKITLNFLFAFEEVGENQLLVVEKRVGDF